MRGIAMSIMLLAALHRKPNDPIDDKRSTFIALWFAATVIVIGFGW